MVACNRPEAGITIIQGHPESCSFSPSSYYSRAKRLFNDSSAKSAFELFAKNVYCMCKSFYIAPFSLTHINITQSISAQMYFTLNKINC